VRQTRAGKAIGKTKRAQFSHSSHGGPSSAPGHRSGRAEEEQVSVPPSLLAHTLASAKKHCAESSTIVPNVIARVQWRKASSRADASSPGVDAFELHSRLDGISRQDHWSVCLLRAPQFQTFRTIRSFSENLICNLSRLKAAADHPLLRLRFMNFEAQTTAGERLRDSRTPDLLVFCHHRFRQSTLIKVVHSQKVLSVGVRPAADLIPCTATRGGRAGQRGRQIRRRQGDILSVSLPAAVS
jgi:hypothetical protein